MKGDVDEQPLPAPSRVISNQSTIETNPSRNSHLDMSDSSTRRMFGLEPDSSSERVRRMELILDQCETVRFPFKKRLILANMNLTQDEIPVDQICSDRLGAALYKLSLAGNRLNAIPREFVANLKSLRVLDFSQCDLTSVPDDWNLPCLKKLNLSHNKIETFLSEVSSLTWNYRRFFFSLFSSEFSFAINNMFVAHYRTRLCYGDYLSWSV